MKLNRIESNQTVNLMRAHLSKELWFKDFQPITACAEALGSFRPSCFQDEDPFEAEEKFEAF